MTTEDAHSPMVPDPTSNFFRDPCLLCSCLVFFFKTLDFKHCSLLKHIFSDEYEKYNEQFYFVVIIELYQR